LALWAPDLFLMNYSPPKEEGLGVGEALFNKTSFIKIGSLTFYK
jgi:hypothetical protein